MAEKGRGKVMLMATCLCDGFFFEVAKATYEVLDFLGCEIVFPEAQTCCGQPAFNSGDWNAARKVIAHTVETFEGDLPVVIPSGSCAAMLKNGASLAFENEADPQKEKFTQSGVTQHGITQLDITKLSKRSWEVADFIVNELGISKIPGKLKAKVALHQACHTRGSGTISAASTLLKSIEGIEILEYGEKDQCCGFGGTFSVSFPHISTQMGQLKIENLLQSQPDYVVSPDMSCLMHQKGLAEKQNIPFKARHFIQIIRDSLDDQIKVEE